MSVASDPLPLLLEVHPGREIVRQGEPYPDAWVIRRGALLMETIDLEGHRLVLDVLGPGDLVGSPTRWTADASVRALVTSGVFVAGPVALRDGLARRARRASWLACSVAWDRISDKLVARLDDLAGASASPSPGDGDSAPPHARASRGAHGRHAGSVNRALGELAAEGVHRANQGAIPGPDRGSEVRAAPTRRTAASQGCMNRNTAPCP